MDHIAHDGTGADQADGDDQIEEARRFQTRQGIHLGAALALEDAEGLGFGDHLEDARVIKGDALGVDAGALDHFRDRRQHAQAQHIDLDDAGVFQRFLVPLHHRAVWHCRRLGGQAARERQIGDDLAAVVDADMARIAQQALADIEKRFQMRRGILAARLSLIAQIGVHGRRKAPGFGDIADDAAMAVGDEGASHRRVPAPVLFVELLNDRLARFGIEVHIDIGGHLALFR